MARLAILHFAGDANVPWVRVPHTESLARYFRSAPVLLGLACHEAAVLTAAFGPGRVLVCGEARCTLTELTETMATVRALGVDTLLLSTEPGQMERAYLMARILYAGRGVMICRSPSVPGAYQSPWWDTAGDVLRALVTRTTGIIIPRRRTPTLRSRPR